jgi:hypothetical protein
MGAGVGGLARTASARRRRRYCRAIADPDPSQAARAQSRVAEWRRRHSAAAMLDKILARLAK